MLRTAPPVAASRHGQCACEFRGHNGGANIACVMAVGRDVPIAPHRPVAVGNARG